MTNRRTRRWSRSALAATIGGALLLTAACSSTPDGPEDADASQVAAPSSARAGTEKVIFAAAQDPGTLDYTTNNLTALRLWIPGNVVEPLVYFVDGEPTPAVAESWEISEDQLTYVFQIRDAVFSNGEPVTVEDVIFSIETMRNSPIGNYSGPLAPISSIEATGEREVTIGLNQPSRAFFKALGGMSGLIQPEASFGEIATNPIGTGPYVLDSYRTDAGFEFSVNESYYGEAPEVTEVEVRIITEGTSALNALRAGDIDAYPVITIDMWERLATDGYGDTFTLETYPQVGEMLYAIFNSNEESTGDKALRQALAQSFDRQQFIDAYGAQWGASATCTYGLSADPWYTEEADFCPLAFDVDAAAAGVDAVGATGQSFDFTSLSDVADLSLPADLMIAHLESTGIEIERNAIELARYSQTIFQARPPQFEITVMSASPNIDQFACPDPAAADWHTYCSAEFTDLVTQADAASTEEDYVALMIQASEVLADDAVIVPLLAKDGVGLLHPELEGFTEPTIAVDIQFKNLSWK